MRLSTNGKPLRNDGDDLTYPSRGGQESDPEGGSGRYMNHPQAARVSPREATIQGRLLLGWLAGLIGLGLGPCHRPQATVHSREREREIRMTWTWTWMIQGKRSGAQHIPTGFGDGALRWPRMSLSVNFSRLAHDTQQTPGLTR